MGEEEYNYTSGGYGDLEGSITMIGSRIGRAGLYALAIFFLLSCHARALLISPSKLTIQIPSGSEKRFSIFLANVQETDDIQVRIYPEDFLLKQDGSLEFLKAGSSKWSCARWISLEHTQLVLKAGEEKSIYGTIKVPQELSGGRYALIMVEVASPPVDWKIDLRTRVRYSILVNVLVSPDQLVRKAQIVNMEVLLQDRGLGTSEQRKIEGLEFVVSVQNTGNVHVVAEGEVRVRNRLGEVEASVPLLAGGGYIFPEGIRDFRGILSKNLPDGEYEAEAEIYYNEGELTRTKIIFSLTETELIRR